MEPFSVGILAQSYGCWRALNYDPAKKKRTLTRPDANTNRRRCPFCAGSLFRDVASKPNLRLCRFCGGTFDLIKDGVVPNLKPKKVAVEKSGVTGAPVRYREFVELKRDPFLLMNLALTIRR